MPRRRRVAAARSVPKALARFVGWLTALAGIMSLSYVVHRWPDKAGANAAALAGCAIAMLNDSWEAVANADPTGHFPPMHPPRALLHDLFSFAVCTGGLLIALFAKIREERAAGGVENFPYDKDWHDKQRMLTISLSILGAVAICRFIFIVWGGCRCSLRRRRPGHRRRRHRSSNILL